MSLRSSARLLGRRGGLKRARSLSQKQRKKIASLGGRAKALSFHAVRRVEDNFRFLEVLDALRIISNFLQAASPKDLFRMKELAYADRRSAADAQDLEFLNRLVKSHKK